MTNRFSLKGKTFVLTGAGGMLGKYFAECLSDEQANLALVDISFKNKKEPPYKIETNHAFFNCDITSKKSVDKLVIDILKKFGRIDGLINNAALNDSLENNIQKLNIIEPESYDSLMKMLSINIGGTYNISTAFAKDMIKNKSGTIVNIASTYGLVSPDQSIYLDKNKQQLFIKGPGYPLSKAGVVHLTKYLAALWADTGITVNSLSPGGVQVDGKQDKQFIENYANRCPMSRMAIPSDYISPLIYMLSGTTPYMTGANLVVDGGWTKI